MFPHVYNGDKTHPTELGALEYLEHLMICRHLQIIIYIISAFQYISFNIVLTFILPVFSFSLISPWFCVAMIVSFDTPKHNLHIIGAQNIHLFTHSFVGFYLCLNKRCWVYKDGWDMSLPWITYPGGSIFQVVLPGRIGPMPLLHWPNTFSFLTNHCQLHSFSSKSCRGWGGGVVTGRCCHCQPLLKGTFVSWWSKLAKH